MPLFQNSILVSALVGQGPRTMSKANARRRGPGAARVSGCELLFAEIGVLSGLTEATTRERWG